MENQVNPRVIKYMNWLAKQESAGGTKMYGDDFGKGPTSAGLFHWNNDKKPLTGDGIPAQFKRDAIQFGFNPNDFSVSAQKKVGYAKINDDFNKLGDFVQVDAKWNGATFKNGRYVHNSKKRYNDLIAGSQDKYASAGSTMNDLLGTQTAYASDSQPTQITQPQPVQDERSLGAKVGAGVTNAFIKPAEQNIQNALATVGGLGSTLGQKARSALLGKGTPQTLQQNIEGQRAPLGEMPTLTETFTGERVNPRNLATKTGLKQATGDVLEGALTYGTGGESKLAGKILGAVSQSGKGAVHALTRGQIGKGVGVGAGYGLGMGTSEQLKQDQSFTDPSTYLGIGGATLGGALAGGTLSGLSKGAQLLREKNLAMKGDEVGALGSKIRREVGINPFGETPEAQQAFQSYKAKDVADTRGRITELLETNASVNQLPNVTNKLRDIGDDTIDVLQRTFAERPVKFTKDGKPNVTDALNYSAELLDNVAGKTKEAAMSLSKGGVKLPVTDVYRNLQKVVTEGTPGMNKEMVDDMLNESLNILNKPVYSKNGFINFENLHDIRQSGNAKFGDDTASKKVQAYEYLSKAIRNTLDDPKSPLNKMVGPEQKRVLDAYKESLNTYGKVADSKWLVENIGKAKIKPSGLTSSVAGFFGAGLTGSAGGPLGTLAYAGSSKLANALQQAAGKTKVSGTVASKLPKSLKEDIVENTGRKVSSAVSGLDLLTKASKTKQAASKRVQATVKAAEQEANKVLPTIQIGTQKAKSQGIKTLKKVAEKAKKLPTIDF